MDVEDYRAVASGNRPPAYVRSAALLDSKIEQADRMLKECRLCERKCGADRTVETGFCGVGSETRYFFEQILWGEEAPLVPSHEIFFTGCNMRCAYCYSSDAIVDTCRGVLASPEDLAQLIEQRRAEGAINVNLIGGEPTVDLPTILRALKLLKTPTPVIWNSNFYMSKQTMALLDGVVDLYLGDMRFGNDACGSAVGLTDRYFEIACRNFQLAAKSADLIIRHLVMPGHVECCLRPIAEWVAAKLPWTPFNPMFQYVPFFRALDDPLLCRSVTPEEEAEARRIVSSLGLNTEWNMPIDGAAPTGTGSGQFETTVIVRPDGSVAIMHLHEDLMKITQALSGEGDIE